MSRSALIGLDWGTSQLRAYRFGADGQVQERRSLPHGIRHLPAGGFEAALALAVSGWDEAPLLACGMVGSRNGWHEAPYLDTPVDVARLAGALIRFGRADGRSIWLVPGLREPHRPDVMRGEETQILGVLAQFPSLAERGALLLPGTHSKWVSLRDGAVAAFTTVMTGELFGLLRDHSLLGAALPEAVDDAAAFHQGVQMIQRSGGAGALACLFSTRARMLEGSLAASSVPDYLSGLLIGDELRIAQAAGWIEADHPLLMVGEGPLCRRYQHAAELLGVSLQPAPETTTAQGLWHIAKAAGLLTDRNWT
ncbi:2-dehydro-3-deoxygalactonokinase [Frateuria aurantia]